MSSLNFSEQRFIEKVLDMGGGYVLDFTNDTFGALFKRHGVDIHGDKYLTYGTSKAKKMRAFWEKEADQLVSKVLSEILDNYEAQCELGDRESDTVSLSKSRDIVARLCGNPINANSTTDVGFLDKEFEPPNIQRLPVDFAVSEIIQDRLKESKSCLSNGAHLSVIFQCGSVWKGFSSGRLKTPPKNLIGRPRVLNRTVK